MASDLLWNLHYRSFFDLTPEHSLNVGASYANGVTPVGEGGNRRTRLGGVDLTYIWKPLARGKYRSFLWQTELMGGTRPLEAGAQDSFGLYSFARYQLGRRWYVGGRFDYSLSPRRSRPEHPFGLGARRGLRHRVPEVSTAIQSQRPNEPAPLAPVGPISPAASTSGVAGFIEPKPGIPPSPKDLIRAIELIRRERIHAIVHTLYYDDKPSRFVAEKTGARMITLATSVGELPT